MGTQNVPWTKKEMCSEVSKNGIEFIKVFLFRSRKRIEQPNDLPSSRTPTRVALESSAFFFRTRAPASPVTHELAEPREALY